MAFKLEVDMTSFFRELQNTQDQTKRAIMQFQYDIASQILALTQRNIKKVFGVTSGRSTLTLMSRGSTARRSGRGGGLLQSANIERVPGGVAVVVGGSGAPYAAVHEEGGTITPKSSKYLTIPAQPKYGGKRAREFSDLRFGFAAGYGPVLMVRDWNKKNGRSANAGVDPKSIAFILRESVTIPARPYLRPAVDEATQDDKVKARMRQLLGRNNFGVEVE